MVFFRKLVSLVSVIFTTWFLFLAPKLVNSERVSFSISNFNNNKQDIILQGSAKIKGTGYLALTDPKDPTVLVGHALYTTPVPIWDRRTGNIASFITSFSFILENVGNSNPADGIVFFLAPPDTEIPKNSNGGNLGVVDGNSAFNHFVGVEFDNYVNSWDPKYSHIGINVNSLTSLKTAPWNRVNKLLVNVSINYDSLSKTLSVVLTDQNGQLSTVAQVLDLKDIFPNTDTVRIGFSASTSGPSRQTHDIHSWSFASVLNENISSITSNYDASYA